MSLIQGSVKYPHTVVVLVLLCGIFGVIALRTIPVQLKPSLDKPEITIQTVYRGASPYEVEEQLTRLVEEEMDSVEGINRVTSTSSEGRSEVKLEFDWGIDKNAALIDVINKLNQAPDFPDDAEEPAVNSVTSESTEPVMWIVSETESLTPNELFELIEDTVEPQLRRVTGVGDMWVFGGEEREMQIRIDPDALVARKVTITEFAQALRRENMNVRGGFFEEGKWRYTLRTIGQFDSVEDVENVIISRSERGTVYLKEVASVSPGYKKRLSQVHTNGQPTVVMGVLRKSGANVVELSQSMKQRIREINEDFARKGVDFELAVAYTDEDYIRESIDLAWENLAKGAMLAAIILLFFLRSWRSLLVVAITIPVCLITVFIFFKGFGRSLNIISLAGLAFSSGLIVDNAIVVIENIYRHLSMGKKGLVAAQEATSEVWGAIMISTLTTLAVFLPVIFIEEEAGQLFKDIAIAICLAISLSLLAAVTVIPMLSSRLCHPPKSEEEWATSKLRHLRKVVHLLTFRWVGTIAYYLYSHIMHFIIGRSPLRILLKVGIILVVCLLFWQSLRLLPPAEYLPSGNRNLILTFATPLVSNNLDKSLESIRPFEQMLLQDNRVERFFTVLGNRFNAVGVIVKKAHADERSMQAFVGELFGKTRGLTGFESLFPVQTSIFRDPGKQIEIDIIGPDLDRLQQIAGRMQGQLFGTDGVQFVRSSFSAGSPEVQVRLNRERCSALGLRVSEVADVIEGLVAGKVIGLYNEGGDQIDLTLYAKDELVGNRLDLSTVQIWTPAGRAVRLDTVAEIVTTTGPTAINHVEKERSITLTVNLTPEVALEDAIETIQSQVLNPVRATLPTSYFIRLAGTADKLDSTLAALVSSFILAILIVYLLMVALFRSWVYPFIIMVTIPMAMSGAFLGISLAHKVSGGLITFDVIAMLGLIILSGIVVNNAILIVHQALNFRATGLDPDEALKQSCDSRLRPICMSIMTSVLAMFPLAFGTGAGTELYRGLGVVMIGGLVVSTVFTLFLVPAIFSLVQDIQIAIHGKEKLSGTDA